MLVILKCLMFLIKHLLIKTTQIQIFYNYQAQPQAIIKVGFYNTLVDAYKLINSCMCNCDCSCNSNCVCNTNCGCNYG